VTHRTYWSLKIIFIFLQFS